MKMSSRHTSQNRILFNHTHVRSYGHDFMFNSRVRNNMLISNNSQVRVMKKRQSFCYSTVQVQLPNHPSVFLSSIYQKRIQKDYHPFKHVSFILPNLIYTVLSSIPYFGIRPLKNHPYSTIVHPITLSAVCHKFNDTVLSSIHY
jgi:hypothetical protein